jgi:hypothetical protein
MTGANSSSSACMVNQAQYLMLLCSFREQLQQHVWVHAVEAVTACREIEQSLLDSTGKTYYSFLHARQFSAPSIFMRLHQVKALFFFSRFGAAFLFLLVVSLNGRHTLLL